MNSTQADPQTRLNITEVAMPSSAPAAAAAPAAEEAAVEEKPKEKTMFTVKLDAIDAGQKAKIIREVKAMMPNMNLVEVGHRSYRSKCSLLIFKRPRSSSNPHRKH